MSAPQKTCIYCGKSPLTKEHIWPEWLKRYIPRAQPSHRRQFSLVHPTHIEPTVGNHAGDIQTVHVKIVCENCNSGWMSRLQNNAKPVVLKLAQGQHATLNLKQQQLLAAWVAMSVISSEYVPPGPSVTPQSERDFLRDHQLAPENWNIWIGHFFRRDWPSSYVRSLMEVVSKKQATIHDPGDGKLAIPTRPNTQTVSLIVGQLYIHAATSSMPVPRRIFREMRFLRGRRQLLRRIWPTQDASFFHWPPLRRITDYEADKIAKQFFQDSARCSVSSPEIVYAS